MATTVIAWDLSEGWQVKRQLARPRDWSTFSTGGASGPEPALLAARSKVQKAKRDFAEPL